MSTIKKKLQNNYVVQVLYGKLERAQDKIREHLYVQQAHDTEMDKIKIKYDALQEHYHGLYSRYESLQKQFT